MKKHLNRIDHRYKCPVDGCSEFQTRRENVTRHLKAKHKGEGDEIFSKVRGLVKQEFKIILDGKFVCFNCNEQFACKQNLTHHDLGYHTVGVHFEYFLCIFQIFSLNNLFICP